MKLKFLHRAGALILALALLLSFPLCISAEEVVEPSADITVTLDQTALSLEMGERVRLVAAVKKDGAVVADATVAWSNDGVGADGKAVVRTNKYGDVVSNSVGTATVTATYTAEDSKTYTATCTVTVSEPTVDVMSVEITTEVADAYDIGDTVALIAEVSPDNATDKSVTWSSSGTAVATVNSDGVVTAVAPGKATITVTTADGGKTDSVDIVVSGIVLPSKLDILVGHDDMLTPQIYGSVPVGMTQWTSSNISIAEVSESGKITTYNLGTTTITVKAGGYKATCMVTVKEDVADAVITSMDSAEVYSFSSLVSQINSKIFSKTGKNLNYLSSLTVPTSQGVLYYGYVSPDVTGFGVGGETYYRSPSTGQRALSDVTFVPKTGFSGTAVITYTARDTGGGTVNGSIRINVTSVGDVAYNTASGRPVTFVTEDFTQICKAKTGREISYITFTQPSSSQGVLYYNYSPTAPYSPEVNSGTKYYRTNNPYLDKVTFVPAEDYTGTVTIPYLCTTAGGTHSGTVTILVYAAPGSDVGKVQYTVASGSYVELNDSDLNNVCWDLNGTSLNYVYFTQPDPSEGTLYYNYESINDYGSVVSETTRYFRSSSPWIDNVAFVPAKGFNGTARVPFTGYDSLGRTFAAELVFKVSGSTGSVYYSTSSGQPLEFNGLDFNEACQKATGASLDWISFELPVSRQGVLYRYYYYYSTNSYGTKLSASARLSRSQLSDVVFLPHNNFYGTVIIPFSGYDTNGGRFSGEVEIFVEASNGDETVSYSTVSGGVLEFAASDFNDACRAITGENLSYIRFSTLPAAKYGKLYYQYDADKDNGTTVYSTTSYYRGKSRLLGDVSFVASDSYSGEFTMKYTGWSTGGEKFTGEVEFTVSKPVAGTVSYSGSALPITLKAEDFRRACVETMGRELDYIRFTSLPGETQGGLYCNYVSTVNPGTRAALSTNYYARKSPSAGDLTFLAKAEYQGWVSFAYTGYDIQGKSYTGTVTVQVSHEGCTTQFLDLQGYDWAKPSVEFLRHSGVTNGYSATRYGPSQQISRGEFTLMLYRALGFRGDGSTISYTDVPPTSYYAEAIAAAKQLGIAEGSSDGAYYPDLPISRQSALSMVYRALEAMGREVPLVSTSVLNSYADSDEVSSYARTAMATMVYMGIVRGDNYGCLNPSDPISRAEMAVVLHRVLTA